MANDHFEELIEGLPAEDKAELYQALIKSGISRNDTILARFFRVFQIYKSYYTTIMEAVREAVKDASQLKGEMSKSALQARESATACERTLKLTLQAAERVNDAQDEVEAHIGEAVQKGLTKATDIVSNDAKRFLSAEFEKTVPLEKIKEASKTVSSMYEGLAKVERAAKAIKLSYLAGLAGVALVLALALGISSYFYCKAKFDTKLAEERIAMAKNFEENAVVLIELAKFKRKVEIGDNVSKKGKKVLFIRDTKGWTSTTDNGVIELE